MTIDVEAIKRDYLISEVVSRYVPAWDRAKTNASKGDYWACCPLHSEKTASFHCEDAKGMFYCMGCGEGGDLVSFVQEVERCDFRAALAIITGERPTDPANRPAPPPVEPPVKFLMPPEDTPPFVAGEIAPLIYNPKRDRVSSLAPEAIYPYRDQAGQLVGYVFRCLIGDKKWTPAITWGQSAAHTGWHIAPMPAPRPVYRLADALARPGGQILITEGEKCADAGSRLSAPLSVSWCGGGQAWDKTDWSPLRGRKVVLWPDNDAPGDQTMLGGWTRSGWKPGLLETLLSIGCEVKAIQRPKADKPDGWDIADAFDEGMSADDVKAWMRERAVIADAAWLEMWKGDPPAVEPARPAPKSVPQLKVIAQVAPAPDPTPSNVVDMRAIPIPNGEDWRAQLVFKDAAGEKIDPKAARNAHLFLEHLPELKGVFTLDVFTGEVTIKRPTPWHPFTGNRPLTKNDRTAAQGLLEFRELRPSRETVAAGIDLVAAKSEFDPIADYLNGLVWDGVSRIEPNSSAETEGWLTHYAGAEPSQINNAFGKKWLISAVARGLDHGCKVDTMIVFESRQGKFKSTIIETLATINGRVFYGDEVGDLSSKESSIQIQKSWIVEMSEMAAVKKADAQNFKKFMSRTFDEYRPVHGVDTIRVKRKMVFAGTINPTGAGYLIDPTGSRRIWPVAVVPNEDRYRQLKADKDQLWAEAVALYKAGEQWHLTKDEEVLAEAVQRSRFKISGTAAAIAAVVGKAKQITLSEIFRVMGIDNTNKRHQIEDISSTMEILGYDQSVGADPENPLETVFVRRED